MHPYAYVLALVSSFCNAIFFAPNRLESVKSADIHPIVYNWYTTMGVFVFSWWVATYLPYAGLAVVTFTPAGFVAGALFTLALCFSCLALPLLGMSIAMGIWCGAAIVVSFLWGTVGPDVIARPLADVPLSAIAVLLELVGVLGIINCDQLGKKVFGKCCAGEHESLLDGAGVSDGSEAFSASKKFMGVIYALSVGCFGGSMLAPLSFLPPEFAGLKGLGFIPSFGTGSLIMGTVILILLRICQGPIKFACSQTLWAGLTSGCVWQFGNVCQVIAQSYYGLPYAIAYPIFQASMVFAGFLGIVAFNEITGTPAISFFYLCAAIVVAGAAMLAVYGPVA